MSTLYRIDELSEVLVDACLRDDDGELLFMSVIGRDSMLMQMIAAFELQDSSGLRTIRLVDSDGYVHRVKIGDKNQLDKHSGRIPGRNLFGPLSHMWVFNKSLLNPDLVSRIAWVLDRSDSPGDASGYLDRCWATLQHLSPVALLDHWREPIMTLCFSRKMIRDVGGVDSPNPSLGGIKAMRISLGHKFPEIISTLVADRLLTV